MGAEDATETLPETFSAAARPELLILFFVCNVEERMSVCYVCCNVMMGVELLV